MPELTPGPLSDETRMKRLLKRSKKTFVSKAEATATPLTVAVDQKLLIVKRCSSTPSRVWMRTKSLLVVTTKFVPTAPCVSGGMFVLERNCPLKVLVGPGEGPLADGGGAFGVGSSPTGVKPP